MVQLMNSTNRRLGPEMEPSLEKSQVKLEIEDSLEEEYGPYNKRSKPSSPHSQVGLLFFFIIFNNN